MPPCPRPSACKALRLATTMWFNKQQQLVLIYGMMQSKSKEGVSLLSFRSLSIFHLSSPQHPA